MGLGRSFFGRTLCAPVGALVVVMLSPPLPHNHGAHRAALVAQMSSRCTADLASPHFHSGRTRPAPDCPACAAGPAASGTPVHAPDLAAVQAAVPTPASPPQAHASWFDRECGARAPPLRRGV